MYKLRQQDSLVGSGTLCRTKGSLVESSRQWSFAPVKVIQHFYVSDFICLRSKRSKPLANETVRLC